MTDPPDAAPALSVWARAADAATFLLGLTALDVAVFGGIRVGTLFSMSNPWRAVFGMVAVCGLRHYLVRTPPLHRRVWNGLRGAWRDEAVSAAWPIAVVTRVSVLLVGYLAVVSVGYAPDTPPIRFSDNEAVNLPLRWDAGWYVDIAMDGYRWHADVEGQQNIAFFPGYPLVTKGVANLLGAHDVLRRPLDSPADSPPDARERRTLPDRPVELPEERTRVTFLGSALFVSLLSFAWSLVWLYRLAREHLDAQAARGALLLLAAYPFAVFFSAAYTESLMLLAVVGAFYHAKQRKWGRAAAWGLVAGLTRPNGFLLAGPLAVLALQQVLARRASQAAGERQAPARRASQAAGDRLGRQVLVAGAACAMPVAGALLYSAFIHTITGDPFAWREAHTAWGRSYTGLGLLRFPFDWASGEGVLPYTSARPIQALNLAGAILACALIWPVTRRFGAAYGLFMVLNVAPPLLFGGYLSMGRVTSLLFPMFLYLGLVLADRQRQALIAGFACVQGLAAVLFFTWRRFL